jgi:hypothetical protein
MSSRTVLTIGKHLPWRQNVDWPGRQAAGNIDRAHGPERIKDA